MGVVLLISFMHYENNSSSLSFQLGKRLFYDPILSADSSTSCASCHSPFSAFAHNDHELSHGIGDRIGFRNAPALFNLKNQTSFMWDGAIHHLEVQPLAPIHNSTEMGNSMREVVLKLKRNKKYQDLFYQIYRDTAITGERVLKCLAAFQQALVSRNAKYDSVRAGTSTFTTQEKKGYALYKKHCQSCHREPLFTGDEFVNNGLDIDTSLQDYGRMRVTNNPKDRLKFKIPSLRNLSYTYPYMHDGRFKKLYQVMQHYTVDICKKTDVDKRIRGGIPLTKNDNIDLIAFLLTLNDVHFTRDTTFRMNLR